MQYAVQWSLQCKVYSAVYSVDCGEQSHLQSSARTKERWEKGNWTWWHLFTQHCTARHWTELNCTALHFIVLHTALQCTTLHCRQVIARQVNHNQQYLGIFRRNYTALYSVQCKVCTVEFTMFYVHSKHLQLRSCCSAKSKHTCKTKNGIRQYVNSLFR